MNNIRKTLSEMGIKAHLDGYEQMACAIEIQMREPRKSLMDIYKEVGTIFGVAYARVERNIRYAIAVWLKDISPDRLYTYFGNAVKFGDVITNKQFIRTVAMVVEKTGGIIGA